MHFHSITCDCNGCSNNCEVITILEGADEVPHYTNIKDIKGNIIATLGRHLRKMGYYVSQFSARMQELLKENAFL